MRRATLGPPLAALRADKLGDLEFHHLRRDGPDGRGITSACSSSVELVVGWRGARGGGRGLDMLLFALGARRPAVS